MMKKFTRDERQGIVREFALRHNGRFNPTLFLEEVRRTGPSHPAYDWFEWDEKIAAKAYQVQQARDFARDLRVVFRVESVGRDRPVSVKRSEMPLVLSPMDGRREGGGYILVDPDNPEHMREHCRQAASSLHSWLNRYESALEFAGRRPAEIRRIIAMLEGAAESVPDTVE